MAAPQQPQQAPSQAPAPGPQLTLQAGPGQQPQLQTQAAAQAQAQAQAAAQAQDFDPVQRYKMLIPQLKESLQNLMKIAAQNLIQNTNIDNGLCHPVAWPTYIQNALALLKLTHLAQDLLAEVSLARA
uniref:Mediator of RNA polymerase II transcription subunit 29 n=1 Tax=Chrysemys picta bellii TaxID=8478 RepID=A0A8C3I0X5_CHRPI